MQRASAYRKAIVAALGVLFIVAAQLGLALGAGLEDAIVTLVDAVIGLLTVLGVFQVKNEPQPPRL